MNQKQIILKYGSLKAAFRSAIENINFYSEILQLITYNFEVKTRYENKLNYYTNLKKYLSNEEA
jgi:hypothetical protein